MNNKLDFKKIGYRIQHFRLQNKMTQEQLAELVGTTQKHLSRIEGGYHGSSFNTIFLIAKHLNISMYDLLSDYEYSDDEIEIQLILNEIKGMNQNQLAILRENIETIKKYGK